MTDISNTAATVDRLLTTADAAQYLSLSVSTLERYRITGTPQIPYVKIGGKRGRVLYRLKDLIAFVERSVRTSTSQPNSEAIE